MSKKIDLNNINLLWIGSLEDKYRLISEYRMLEFKIQDTIDYLDALIEEQVKIEEELLKNIEVVEV